MLACLTAPVIAGVAGAASANPTILSGEASDAVQCYRLAGRAHTPPPGAAATCTAALESGDLDRETRAATLANRGLIHRRHGNIAAASDDCRAAMALGQDDPAAAVTCAAVFINAGAPEKAIALLEETALPAPDQRYKLYHNLALAHHDLGEYGEAHDWLEKTLAAKPDFAPAKELKQQYRVSRHPIAK